MNKPGYLLFGENSSRDQMYFYARTANIEGLPETSSDPEAESHNQPLGPLLVRAEPSELGPNIYDIPSGAAQRPETLYSHLPFYPEEAVKEVAGQDLERLRHYESNRDVARLLAQLAMAQSASEQGELIPTPQARNYLHIVLSTELLRVLSDAPHLSWLAGKQQDLDDPENPFRGYGEARIRVRDLPPELRQAFGIPEDYNPSADVKHPLFKPPDELDEATRGKNMGPVIVLATALGDIILPEGATIDDLIETLRTIAEGSDPEINEKLSVNQHIGYLVSEARAGARPFGANPHPDFRLFGDLSPEVQALDLDTIRPVAQELVDLLVDPSSRSYMKGLIAGGFLAIVLEQQ